ncbi:aspartate 1-decarboxylase [Candidatus Margulisiibacteriota bacterium]
MLITMMKSKISYAKVTQTDLYYVGSITIDAEIMKKANILPNERVQIVNINNGARFETYAIKGDPGSKVIGINGPAARLAQVDDVVFIISYASIDPKKEKLEPVVLDLRK